MARDGAASGWCTLRHSRRVRGTGRPRLPPELMYVALESTEYGEPISRKKNVECSLNGPLSLDCQVAQFGGGVSAGFCDGATGFFTVGPTDKTGRDLRGKGLLRYVGEHHLRFAETGEWFLKVGADSPENFLAYEGFDNTPNAGGRRKTWAPHLADFRPGDPTYDGGKGKEIIGAINYLSSKGMNAFSFLTLSMSGDDENVFPFVSRSAGEDRLRMDTSKLAQWEVVLEHADRMGMFLHFKTQEQENDQILDGGELGMERRLYYRELIARFGHHLALNWNLGEENTNTDAQRKEFAAYIRELDPYDHPIVVHTFPNQPRSVYTPLLGVDTFDGASLQVNPESQFARTLEWIQSSAAAGRKWVASNDEQGPPDVGVAPDDVDPTHTIIRKQVLWANFMAGGAGVEYYFGYQYPNSDLTCEDFRSRDAMWTLSKHALDFFYNFDVPFWSMANADSLVSDGNHCLVQGNGDVLVVYLPDGGTDSIDLPGNVDEVYLIKWYDPLLGGSLQTGTISRIAVGPGQLFGTAPGNPDQDWVVLLQREVSESSSPTSHRPSSAPSMRLMTFPSQNPTFDPTVDPTLALTLDPTEDPTDAPSHPVMNTSALPSLSPSGAPSALPKTDLPSLDPPSVDIETSAPQSQHPSIPPSMPTMTPSTDSWPSKIPTTTASPTAQPVVGVSGAVSKAWSNLLHGKLWTLLVLETTLLLVLEM